MAHRLALNLYLTGFFLMDSLRDIVEDLEARRAEASSSSMTLVFRRDLALTDALRHSSKSSFDPQKGIKVA